MSTWCATTAGTATAAVGIAFVVNGQIAYYIEPAQQVRVRLPPFEIKRRYLSDVPVDNRTAPSQFAITAIELL